MRLATIVFSLLLVAVALQAAEPGEKQFEFKIKFCEGELAKKKFAKVLSAPLIITAEARPFTLRLGAHVELPKVPGQNQELAEYGIGMHGKAIKLDDVTVRVELQWQNSELVTSSDEELEIKTSGLRLSKTLKLGVQHTIVLNKDAEKQTWAELTITEVDGR